MRQAVVTGVLAIAMAASSFAQDAISLYEVVPSDGDRIPAGSTVEFRLRIQIDTSHAGGLAFYTNGFKIYSPDDARWDTTYGQYLASWIPFGDQSISYYSTNGAGADTVVFTGEDSAGGFWVVYDDVAWTITINPFYYSSIYYGRTICLDTVADTTGPWPNNTWVWHTLTESYLPTWDGPHCFTVHCCNTDGIRGDVNYDGSINVADITSLVMYLFTGGPPPRCPEEGDVNGDDSFDVADLSHLVAYFFQGGPPPLPCP